MFLVFLFHLSVFLFCFYFSSKYLDSICVRGGNHNEKDNQTALSVTFTKAFTSEMLHLPRKQAAEGMGKPVSMVREVIHANQLESPFSKSLHM